MMNSIKPRNEEHWTYTLNIGLSKYAGAFESSYLKDTYTVFLGQSSCFDYWGDPASGRVISAGVPEKGTHSTHFGPWYHWQAYKRGESSSLKLTAAGSNWSAPREEQS